MDHLKIVRCLDLVLNPSELDIPCGVWRVLSWFGDASLDQPVAQVVPILRGVTAEDSGEMGRQLAMLRLINRLVGADKQNLLRHGEPANFKHRMPSWPSMPKP